jgi:hypothetical protein
MFFRSLGSLILAAILIVVGSVQLLSGRRYADAAKSEATAVGVISYLTRGGKSGTTYNYEFEIDGIKLIQDCGTCRMH